MGITLEEQETVIQFNRTDAHATIYTSDSTIMTKLDRLCDSAPDNYKLTRVDTVEGKTIAKFYSLADKTRISFRTKKVERNFTDEEKQKMAERLRNRNQNYGEQSNTGVKEDDEVTSE